MKLRDAKPEDYAAVVSLNQAVVQYLSPLNETKLDQLAQMAAVFKVIEIDEQIAAFILTFREGTEYNSPNYIWFSNTLPSFMYIDRVVVAPNTAGLGLARFMYQEIETICLQNGLSLLVCEVDIEPPNERSLKFHDQQGFEEIARHSPYPNRTVSLRKRELS